jgi:hypothetical protein
MSCYLCTGVKVFAIFAQNPLVSENTPTHSVLGFTLEFNVALVWERKAIGKTKKETVCFLHFTILK